MSIFKFIYGSLVSFFLFICLFLTCLSTCLHYIYRFSIAKLQNKALCFYVRLGKEEFLSFYQRYEVWCCCNDSYDLYAWRIKVSALFFRHSVKNAKFIEDIKQMFMSRFLDQCAFRICSVLSVGW